MRAHTVSSKVFAPIHLGFALAGSCLAGCGDDSTTSGGQGGVGGSSSSANPCEEPLIACDGTCVDPVLDGAHCGACGTICQSGTLCFAGECTGPAPLPRPRAGHAAVAGPDGRIYVVGGHDHADPVADVSVFDPRTNLWTELAPLPEPRAYLGAVWSGNGLLAIGGGILIDGGIGYEAQVLVHAYDPVEDTWSRKGDLSTPRADYAFAASGAAVFAFMGSSAPLVPDSANGTMDELQGAEWIGREVPAGMVARYGAKASTGQDGKIFVCGGVVVDEDAPTELVDIFDPETGLVAPGPTLQIGGLYGATATDHEGRIYYVGGFARVDGRDTATTRAERLVPGGDGWSPIADLPDDRVDTAAAVGSDGRVYVIGGFGDSLARDSSDRVFVYDDARDLWLF